MFKKRITLIISLLLLSSILLLSLVACKGDEGGDETGEPTGTETNSPQEPPGDDDNGGETGEPAGTETDAPQEPQDDDNGGQAGDEVKYFELPDELISVILSGLGNQIANYEVGESLLGWTIRDLKKRKDSSSLVSVTFDPGNYYFACGYFTAEDGHTEDIWCECCEKYIWIGFENEKDILDVYKGQRHVVTVRVSRPKKCETLTSDLQFNVENVAPLSDGNYAYGNVFLIECDNASPNKYVSTRDFICKYYTTKTVKIVDNIYAVIYCHGDDEQVDNEMHRQLLEYYDDLIDKVSFVDYKHNTNTGKYALIPVEDIAEIIMRDD